MNINEQILDQLMTAVENGSPLDFAEALDTALKSKAADAIDARREELASGIHEARKCSEEEEDEDYDEELEEALDAVGKEDGDVDNDGDEDESDEYLKNRREKIGKAIKEEDEEDEEDEDEDDELEEAAKRGPAMKGKVQWDKGRPAGAKDDENEDDGKHKGVKRGPSIKGKVDFSKGRPAG